MLRQCFYVNISQVGGTTHSCLVCHYLLHFAAALKYLGKEELMRRGDDKRQHTSYCSSFKVSSSLLKNKILYVVAICLYFVILLAALLSSEYSECL